LNTKQGGIGDSSDSSGCLAIIITLAIIILAISGWFILFFWLASKTL